jgi:hypothetical protein
VCVPAGGDECTLNSRACILYHRVCLLVKYVLLSNLFVHLYVCLSGTVFFSVEFLISSCLQSVYVCQECIENDRLPSTSMQ